METSRQSISIAKQSLEKSQDLDHQDRRARLGVTRTAFSGEDNLQDVALQLGVTNVGRTPALKVAIKTALTAEHSEVIPRNLFNMLQKEDTYMALLPGQIQLIDHRLTGLNPWDSRDFIQRKQSLYSIGVIDYEDIFEQSHQTKFCFEIKKGLRSKQFAVDPCKSDLKFAN